MVVREDVSMEALFNEVFLRKIKNFYVKRLSFNLDFNIYLIRLRVDD